MYYEFCAYGAEPITRVKPVELHNEIDLKILDSIIIIFFGYNVYSLVELSKHESGAWKAVYGGRRRERYGYTVRTHKRKRVLSIFTPKNKTQSPSLEELWVSEVRRRSPPTPVQISPYTRG